jgi:crotonobetainyl-CoA hydratase
MDYRLIKVEKKGHLTIITINRPEVRNAINPPTSTEMGHAFDEFRDDPDAWVAIVTGAGDRAFSAGNDLKYDALTPPEQAREERSRVRYGMGGLVFNYELDKPLIAAVNGFAMGGGFEIALACDVIVAAETATFSFPETAVGRVPVAGGVNRLVRQIPYHLAMDLLLTRRRLTAQEAHQFGIVSRVVPLAELMTTAEQVAEEIIEGSPLGVRATKEIANRGLDLTLREANATAFPLYKQFVASEDFIEGPKAFAEKRKPRWTGR